MLASVGLPTCMEGMMYPIPFSTPDQVVEIALWAEELGYHSVWGNDHMTTQKYVQEAFPQPPNFWEPLITYAYIAAKTTTLKLGTGILVLPMRTNTVVVAKQLATLDQFSKGRLIVSVGVGAYREEFEALYPNFKANRGDLLAESVAAIRNLFDNRVATWEGEYLSYKNVEMYPKPVQDPLPFYFGGNNPNQVDRAARLAQGWMPAGMPTPTIAKMVADFKTKAESYGRDSSKLEIAPQLICYVDHDHDKAVARFKRSQLYEHLISLKQSTLKDQAGEDMVNINLVGTPAEVVEKAHALAKAGVTHLCGTYYCADDVQELKDQMQLFAEEVMPHI
ncbi:MAG TPA: TIGR03619 family F420-dependent LLM class oxidoreductase [Bellilinea sp.]|nr:TIGR03619 family F420-dependent LLM class oxidoreductase [Bellilinea sp.]